LLNIFIHFNWCSKELCHMPQKGAFSTAFAPLLGQMRLTSVAKQLMSRKWSYKQLMSFWLAVNPNDIWRSLTDCAAFLRLRLGAAGV